ncbi:MAG: family 20 glycosylhydrolase, partial [Gemmatimonadetes bacterium]|nr:family 20 glycosylhydrolase [Gemmatimonadota bacterium]
MPDDPMVNLGVDLIPEPRTWSPTDTMFALGDSVQIEIPEAPEVGDQFAAADLAAALREEWDIDVSIGSPGAIRLQRQTGVAARAEGYQLDVTAAGVTIRGYDAAGLFWGTRTLLQAIRRGAEGPEIPGLSIVDWPAVQLRAMHYDTKHHQGSFAYVQGLIRRLSRYKANALVWEWEDKLAYESHPEIGAPGAFTKQQMQELTAYGRQYHVQIIPLVQGLGHVSYILKHPALRHLREIPDSSWEFCPLNDATYELLFDLWDEAMEATPGSDFCHIGSDETYELGLGEVCGCRAKAAEVGRDGLMKIFLDRCVAHVESRGRRAIAWTALGKQGEAAHPPKGLLLTPTVGGDDL